MSRTVSISLPLASITATLVTLAIGASLHGIQFTLSNAVTSIPPQIAPEPGPFNVAFEAVPEGDYTLTMQYVDSLGNAVNAPFTQPVSVTAAVTPPAQVSVSIPTGPATVTLS